jgi:uncharacterized protein (TIGR00255 family)
MILSMTGFGRGEAQGNIYSIVTEARSVNNRFLEVSIRAPKLISLRDQELKEVVRRYLSRGKVNITITLETADDGTAPIAVNPSQAKAFYTLLNDLRKTLKLRETVKLQHILQFSEIFDSNSEDTLADEEWDAVLRSVDTALQQLQAMRMNEGTELERDLKTRIENIASTVDGIEEKSKDRIPQERERLRERVYTLLNTDEVDEQRLELELVLLSEKLDVTEECVRLRSHLKFFKDTLDSDVPGGRKLNFLIQELHREINTIGSKASDTEISRSVIGMKEEIERIREQIQNIE